MRSYPVFALAHAWILSPLIQSIPSRLHL